MAYAGANGTTETEMRAALHFDLDEPTLHEAFNATGLTLMGRKDEIGNDAPGNPGDPGNKGDGFQLSMVNQAWGQKGHAFLDGYLDVLAVHYGAGLFLLDFGDTEAARTTINGWVQDQTHDRIKDLLPEGSIHSDTPLVLTNAIYFKASWQQKFDPAKTADATFTAPDGTRSVPMMHETTDGQYAAGADYQAVSLPYLSKDVRMLVVLPADGSFDTTVAHFDEAFFQKVVTGLGRYQVTLSMPKFSFESSSGLKPALQALGMNAAFADGADFSGLDGTHNLYIEDVLHKAFVAVDEQGTEAAAATAVIFGEVSLPPSAELTLNRPFIFAIYDEPTGQVLFLGHLVDPG
jgi:serpin B